LILEKTFTSGKLPATSSQPSARSGTDGVDVLGAGSLELEAGSWKLGAGS
jgi:hypothetical protein